MISAAKKGGTTHYTEILATFFNLKKTNKTKQNKWNTKTKQKQNVN